MTRKTEVIYDESGVGSGAGAGPLRKQTSSNISTLAAKYVRMKNDDLFELMRGTSVESAKAKLRVFRDLRKLAASCLSQDETPGQN